LHRVGICHTDIKSKNILFGSGNLLKLIDFGESMKSKLWRKGKTGTYGYRLPRCSKKDIVTAGKWICGHLAWSVDNGN
jgi:serine/threonine protein kinase